MNLLKLFPATEPRMNNSLRVFFLLFLIFLSVCMVFLVGLNYEDLHLSLVGWRNDGTQVNTYVKYYGIIAQYGMIIPAIIAIFLLVWHLGRGLYFLISQVLCFGTIKLFEYLFTTESPADYFLKIEEPITLQTLDLGRSSFLEWYSGAAFGIAFALCFALRDKSRLWTLLIFIIGVCLFVTRIELSMTFAEIELFNNICTVAISSLCAWMYTKNKYQWYRISLVKKLCNQ